MGTQRKRGATVAAIIGLIVLLLVNPPAAERISGQAVGNPGDTTTAATALGALNAAVSVALTNQASASLSCAAGTAALTVTAELSFDGGSTYPVTAFLDDPTSGGFDPTIVLTNPNAAFVRGVVLEHGATNARARVSAFTSGTMNCSMRAVALNSTTIAEGVPSQIYTAIVKAVAAGAAKDYINLFNASGSGKVLRVRGVYAAPDTTAAVTAVSVMGILSRTNTVGTTCTAGAVNAHDSRNAAVPSQVTVSTNCTTDPVVSVDWGAASVATDETPPGGGFGRQVLYEWMPTWGGQPWTLREGEGLMFKSVATIAPVGTITAWVVFTM